MGIRCDQFIGLSRLARKFLDENCIKDHVEIFVNGIKESENFRYKTVAGTGVWYPMFDFDDDGEGFKLPGYVLNNEEVVYEEVQKEISSSGNVIFTCLVDSDGVKIKGSLWKPKEMKEHY